MNVGQNLRNGDGTAPEPHIPPTASAHIHSSKASPGPPTPLQRFAQPEISWSPEPVEDASLCQRLIRKLLPSRSKARNLQTKEIRWWPWFFRDLNQPSCGECIRIWSQSSWLKDPSGSHTDKVFISEIRVDITESRIFSGILGSLPPASLPGVVST